MSIRTAMVYNFEDDNFTFMDASVDKGTSLEDVICMRYQFDPGYQVRWSDLDNGVDENGHTAGPVGDLASGWSDLDNGVSEGKHTAGTPGSMPSKWSDFYGSGDEENIYWLTSDGLYISDQVVKTDGIKDYFVDRILIDFDDVVAEFKSNMWVYAKQMYFYLKSDLPEADQDPNLFDVRIGWSDTLVDLPVYETVKTVNIQRAIYNGTVKHDFRSTGRYLAFCLSFNQMKDLKFTGAEIDVEQTYGR
jgi:hypothetical protein